MLCRAMLFNLEHTLSRSEARRGQRNTFLTFVDVDTGESFRTYVSEDSGLFANVEYAKFRPCDITLSISLGDYNGQPQMNVRILAIDPPTFTVPGYSASPAKASSISESSDPIPSAPPVKSSMFGK